jgi:hypothetical protein
LVTGKAASVDQVQAYERSLNETRDQIPDLRRVDAQLDQRLTRLEHELADVREALAVPEPTPTHPIEVPLPSVPTLSNEEIRRRLQKYARRRHEDGGT